MSNNHTSNIEALTSETTNFNRDITLFGGISILAGIMIGSGAFYLGSYVLIRSNMNIGLALLVWIIGGIITLFSGLCYAELGTMMPKAGGGYVYLREAYGERIAYMSGLSSFILGGSGSIASLAMAFPAALTSFIPMNEWQTKAVAIALVVGLSVVNYFGVKFGAMLQNVFLVGKIIPLAVIIVCGIAMGTQSPDLSIIPAGTEFSITSFISTVAFAVVATMWAYEGWTNLNTISEEIKDPRRNIPRAIVISILMVMALYVAFNFAIYRVLPLDTIQSLFAQGDFFLGTAAAQSLFGKAGMYIVGIGMALAIFGSLNGCVMVFPRSYYAMAKDGMFFPSFAKLHPEHKTPVNAIWGSMIVSIILICMRNLDQLTSLVVFSGLVFNTLTFGTILVFRKKYPQLERPYKVIGYPVVVWLMMAVMIGLAVNTFIEDPVTSLIGLSVPAAGLVLYQVMQARQNRKTH